MDINDGIEIAKNLVSPVEKLLVTVASAIGKIYEPIHINRIANAIRDNIDIPIAYNDSKISINSENFQELAQRASSRMAFQELTKQKNIDNIIYNASEELKNVKNVSEKPVDKDWVLRFFNSVEDISNEKMQEIWGRILAGEIVAPNSYSYRAMEALKKMTYSEIKLFEKISKFVIYSKDNCFIFSKDKLLDKYSITFEEILQLEECGLITAYDLNFSFTVSTTEDTFFHNTDICVKISNNSNKEIDTFFDIYAFTNCGKELLKVTESEKESNYLKEYFNTFFPKYQNIDISFQNIEDINNGNIFLSK